MYQCITESWLLIISSECALFGRLSYHITGYYQWRKRDAAQLCSRATEVPTFHKAPAVSRVLFVRPTSVKQYL